MKINKIKDKMTLRMVDKVLKEYDQYSEILAEHNLLMKEIIINHHQKKIDYDEFNKRYNQLLIDHNEKLKSLHARVSLLCDEINV